MIFFPMSAIDLYSEYTGIVSADIAAEVHKIIGEIIMFKPINLV
ncbi:hypothetical protein GJV44_00787 [Candidatus Vallotia cooleyia]|nr:hypothetical protein GJV44_00787 [Candidatus Vallotia cooleyia]